MYTSTRYPDFAHAPPIHFATVNVRFDGARYRPVPIPRTGAVAPRPAGPHDDAYREQPWAVRRSRLVDALLSSGSLDIVGFQEVYHSQLLDLAILLGAGYGYVGVGRDDGKEAGEYSPIFYDKTRFDLINWKTVWLSPTPEVPGSKGWDASQTRIATLLSLRDRFSGEPVHVVNTHYDDQGVTARAESSLIIRAAVWDWVRVNETPEDATHGRALVCLVGDFNSPPEERGYGNITSLAPLPSGAPSFSFLDSYIHLHARDPTTSGVQSRPYGPAKTYTGFTKPGDTSTTRIDFIMIAAAESEQHEQHEQLGTVGKGGWVITQYACVDNWVEETDPDGFEGRWSDHRAVRATVSRF